MSDNGTAVFASSSSTGPAIVVKPSQQPTLGLHIDGGGDDLVREVRVGDDWIMKIVGGEHAMPTAIFIQLPDPQGNPGPLLPGSLSPLLFFGGSTADFTINNVPPSVQGTTVFLRAFAWDSQVGLIDSTPRKVTFI